MILVILLIGCGIFSIYHNSKGTYCFNSLQEALNSGSKDFCIKDGIVNLTSVNLKNHELDIFSFHGYRLEFFLNAGCTFIITIVLLFFRKS